MEETSVTAVNAQQELTAQKQGYLYLGTVQWVVFAQKEA